jgi:hypothetical protein
MFKTFIHKERYEYSKEISRLTTIIKNLSDENIKLKFIFPIMEVVFLKILLIKFLTHIFLQKVVMEQV